MKQVDSLSDLLEGCSLSGINGELERDQLPIDMNTDGALVAHLPASLSQYCDRRPEPCSRLDRLDMSAVRADSTLASPQSAIPVGSLPEVISAAKDLGCCFGLI